MIGIGILGAGGIAERAMVEPARTVDGVAVVAIGARDPERARAFADRLDLPAWGDYDEVLADPRVDLVYLALPPIIHAEWATRALAAGKNVLCEKPLSANGATAQQIADAADAAGRRAFVGFHFRLHGFIRDLLDTIASGVLGEVKLVEVDFSIPHFVVQPGNIRLDGDLAGGAVMDVGCYAVDLLRTAFGEPEVVSATAQTYDADPRIDLQTDAELRLPGGIPALLRASFLGDDTGAMWVRVDGSEASLLATSVIVPQWGATLTVTSPDGEVLREVAADPAENSYVRQLEHLRDVLADGSESVLDARRGVGTMRVVDAIYRAAGLLPR
ncbi:Gfo/Idh/MocA family oxidoreductase [Microbacterium sp. KSW2-29]|uniref:Gfo/Idh/MocA family oxidoreductase n=1 Tax=Microbacterium phycohabitans TaxID=3075993 RepID=A0ABU3SL16_9MICO|nr:Gfo/Idh/MocA family oxidoreductase [Microbacterium sp. KSW2-29]MDU0345296.1 Gfo/Idh/MocA family oxidoreductase [Microbacterium sp. KSW2-29]